MHNDIMQKKELIAHLEQRITENKRQKINEVLVNRTSHVVVVLEDLFQEHNASAVVRSVECFGIQDLYVIQEKFRFSMVAGIAMGSSKWTSMHNHRDIASAYQSLKDQGYRIVATTPHEGAHTLESLPLEGKLALVFGTENSGLSPQALSMADEFVSIPMYGFTQSFNVSVSVAICLYHITSALRLSSIPWRLSESQALDVKLSWLRRMIRGAAEYEREFFAK